MTGPEADRIGRQIAVRLRSNNFKAAHGILDTTEKELKRPPEVPVNIAELDMDLRTVNMLEDKGLLTIDDLRDVTKKTLMDIPNFGVKGVASVRRALKRYVEESKALCR